MSYCFYETWTKYVKKWNFYCRTTFNQFAFIVCFNNLSWKWVYATIGWCNTVCCFWLYSGFRKRVATSGDTSGGLGMSAGCLHSLFVRYDAKINALESVWNWRPKQQCSIRSHGVWSFYICLLLWSTLWLLSVKSATNKVYLLTYLLFYLYWWLQ